MGKKKAAPTKLEYLPINDLVAYANNARTHSKHQIGQIRASIREFGFNNPILVKDDLTVIAGHGRLEAAKAEGMENVPIVKLSHLTDSQAKAYILADNRIAMNAGWDEELLSLELNDLKALNVDLDLLGFDDDELENFITEPEKDYDESKEDDVPDVEENIHNVERGQIWQLGSHRVMCGDSTDKNDVNKLMNGEKADMVFTDPPYGMNLDTDYSKLPDSNRMGEAKSYKKVQGDDQEFDPSVFIDLADEVISFGADYYADKLPKGGSWYVWDKRVDDNFDRMIGSAFEMAWSKTKHKREIARFNNTLFSGESDAKNKVHPTQKPLKMIEWFFERIKGDLVVDLFLGSGSTLIACEKTNRKCYGMEIDPHYVSVIIERWQQFTGNKAKLLNGLG